VTNEEIIGMLHDVDSRSKSNTRRISELAENQKVLGDLTASVKVLATDQGNLKCDVGEIKADVKSLMAKPAKRWDGLVEKVIYLIVAAMVGYALAKVGIIT
jgi:hypothetical protein